MKKILLTFSLVLVFATAVETLSAQCPMCKANVESARNKKTGEKKKSVGAGLNNGILYLLAMPYVAAAGLGVYWYRNRQRIKNA